MELTKRDVRELALEEDLKHKTNVIFALHEELEQYIEKRKEIKELLRKYDTGEIAAELLVSYLKIIV